MPVLSEVERTRFEAHAVACYPREACGGVIQRLDERRVLCWRNVAEGPAFRLSDEDIALLDRDYTEGWRVAVLFHSHVDAPAYLSGDDRRRARLWPVNVLHAVLSIRHGIPGEWVVESLPAPELSRG